MTKQNKDLWKRATAEEIRDFPRQVEMVLLSSAGLVVGYAILRMMMLVMSGIRLP